MSTPKPPRHPILIIATLILAGEAVFFLPFILPRVFRPTMLHAFGITNLELGTKYSIYGVVALASYLFGGALADRFPARNLMSIALWMTALGGLVMWQLPSPRVLGVLYGYWGFTTIFLFWAALIRATREWGGNSSQGTAFGLLEGGRGLSSSLIGTLGVLIFSGLIFANSGGSASEIRDEQFGQVILMTTLVVFAIGVLVWLLIPKQIGQEAQPTPLPTLPQLTLLIKMPTIWLQAIIIVCAYVGYKITDDFSLYAYDVLGFDERESARVGSLVLWMRPVFALLVGLLADRFASSKMVMLSFMAMIFGGVCIATQVFSGVWVMTLLFISTTCLGVYGIRGVYFTLMGDAKIPVSSTGAAVGIMSIVGFTPDIFMGPVMGYLLDANPGVLGHQLVFTVLSCSAAIGLLASGRFWWVTKV